MLDFWDIVEVPNGRFEVRKNSETLASFDAIKKAFLFMKFMQWDAPPRPLH